MSLLPKFLTPEASSLEGNMISVSTEKESLAPAPDKQILTFKVGSKISAYCDKRHNVEHLDLLCEKGRMPSTHPVTNLTKSHIFPKSCFFLVSWIVDELGRPPGKGDFIDFYFG